MQASLMLHHHQPEETKPCRVKETGVACGPEELLLSNKTQTIWQKKNYAPLWPLVRVFSSLFPHNAFQRVDPSFFPAALTNRSCPILNSVYLRCAALHPLEHPVEHPSALFPLWSSSHLAGTAQNLMAEDRHGNLGRSWELSIESLPTFPWICSSHYALPYPQQPWNHY